MNKHGRARRAAEMPGAGEQWPAVIRGGILVTGVLSSWGLALTALHLI